MALRKTSCYLKVNKVTVIVIRLQATLDLGTTQRLPSGWVSLILGSTFQQHHHSKGARGESEILCLYPCTSCWSMHLLHCPWHYRCHENPAFQVPVWTMDMWPSRTFIARLGLLGCPPLWTEEFVQLFGLYNMQIATLWLPSSHYVIRSIKSPL